MDENIRRREKEKRRRVREREGGEEEAYKDERKTREEGRRMHVVEAK